MPLLGLGVRAGVVGDCSVESGGSVLCSRGTPTFKKEVERTDIKIVAVINHWNHVHTLVTTVCKDQKLSININKTFTK